MTLLYDGDKRAVLHTGLMRFVAAAMLLGAAFLAAACGASPASKAANAASCMKKNGLVVQHRGQVDVGSEDLGDPNGILPPDLKKLEKDAGRPKIVPVLGVETDSNEAVVFFATKQSAAAASVYSLRFPPSPLFEGWNDTTVRTSLADRSLGDVVVVWRNPPSSDEIQSVEGCLA